MRTHAHTAQKKEGEIEEKENLSGQFESEAILDSNRKNRDIVYQLLPNNFVWLIVVVPLNVQQSKNRSSWRWDCNGQQEVDLAGGGTVMGNRK